jgi:hypothetical protein
MTAKRETADEATLAGEAAALRRAAQRARAIARHTGTPLVISKGGRIEKLSLADAAASGCREDFEKHLAAVPDVSPPECDRLD